MKKITLLFLLIATSIVLTSGETYAAWDSTTANTSATITFSNPLTVTLPKDYDVTTSQAVIGSIETESKDYNVTTSQAVIGSIETASDDVTVCGIR